MKFFLIYTLLSLPLMAAEPVSVESETTKILDQQFESLSKDMSPAMKAKLRETMEASKKYLKEYGALTPEQ
jgi:hypothetical protein